MKEKRKARSVIIFESQINKIQQFSDENYDGDFSQGLRKIIGMWINE